MAQHFQLKKLNGTILPKDLVIPEYIDSYYVISETMRKLVREIYPEIKDKIKLTGWPRIDLWKDFRYLAVINVIDLKRHMENLSYFRQIILLRENLIFILF